MTNAIIVEFVWQLHIKEKPPEMKENILLIILLMSGFNMEGWQSPV